MNVSEQQGRLAIMEFVHLVGTRPRHRPPGIEFIPTNGPEWRRGARNFVNIYRVLAVTER
jgi:hypothetical protein